MSAVEQEDSLECGTSLAEYEHYDGRLDHKEDEESAAPSVAALQQQQQNDASNVTEHSDATTSGTDSIASLRERLAADVVTDYCSHDRQEDSSKNENTKMQYTTITSPFRSSNNNNNKATRLPLVYCDHTASNRPVQSIERYMERVCLPLYGNTHTNTSITGSQT